MQRDPTISAFGLGKLGAVLAGCYASRGFHVIGVDIDGRAVDKCKHGIPPVQEPGIEKLYHSAEGRLTASTDGIAAVLNSAATLITVPTPSKKGGEYSLKHVLEACTVTGEALRRKTGYHLVVLKSTVLPGACDQQIIPALERHSGKKCGAGFGFCYNPEFIALGSVIHNIFNPDLLLVGEFDSGSGDHLAAMYDRLLARQAPLTRMNLINTELAKLAVNTYVTMKISFANLLTSLCERLPGANVDLVTAALGQDSRIGPDYMKGGLGYGGPCFPRDNAAMSSLARQIGVSFPLAEATDQVNRDIPRRVAELVESHAPPRGRIGILGLSYKPDTSVIEESQSILIAERLLQHRFNVQVYDPAAMEAARQVLGTRVNFAESAENCIAGADVVLIATPWKQFRALNYTLAGASNRAIIIDCWGLLDGQVPNASVIRLGSHITQPPRPSRRSRKLHIPEKLNVLEE